MSYLYEVIQPGTCNDVQNNKTRVNDGIGFVVYIQHGHC